MMRTCLMQVGFASYAKAPWSGRRNHGGQTYFEEIERHVGDGNEYIAFCADNTSSNTSMQKGLFGLLNKKFNCFFLVAASTAWTSYRKTLRS